jgi:hypothetical protein
MRGDVQLEVREDLGVNLGSFAVRNKREPSEGLEEIDHRTENSTLVLDGELVLIMLLPFLLAESQLFSCALLNLYSDSTDRC